MSEFGFIKVQRTHFDMLRLQSFLSLSSLRANCDMKILWFYGNIFIVCVFCEIPQLFCRNIVTGVK